VLVVVKMILDGAMRLLLRGALYPFFCMPEEEIPANCVIVEKNNPGTAGAISQNSLPG
jgi:hypothetical protein